MISRELYSVKNIFICTYPEKRTSQSPCSKENIFQLHTQRKVSPIALAQGEIFLSDIPREKCLPLHLSKGKYFSVHITREKYLSLNLLKEKYVSVYIPQCLSDDLLKGILFSVAYPEKVSLSVLAQGEYISQCTCPDKKCLYVLVVRVRHLYKCATVSRV